MEGREEGGMEVGRKEKKKKYTSLHTGNDKEWVEEIKF